MRFFVVVAALCCVSVTPASEREAAESAVAGQVPAGIFIAPSEVAVAAKLPEATSKNADEPAGPQVRLVAMKTDIVRRCRSWIPALPCPPFSTWRNWLTHHIDAVHCSLEWRTEGGEWFHAELRSMHYNEDARDKERVGWGELPATGYDAYGIYISKGRLPRSGDSIGHPIEVTLDEEIHCDYRRLENEIRNYAAREFGRNAGQSGDSRTNRGLGGPAFKPSQNSNTMVNYVLVQCGVFRNAPENAVGWDTRPHFPYSSEKDTFDYDNQP